MIPYIESTRYCIFGIKPGSALINASLSVVYTMSQDLSDRWKISVYFSCINVVLALLELDQKLNMHQAMLFESYTTCRGALLLESINL